MKKGGQASTIFTYCQFAAHQQDSAREDYATPSGWLSCEKCNYKGSARKACQSGKVPSKGDIYYQS